VPIPASVPHLTVRRLSASARPFTPHTRAVTRHRLPLDRFHNARWHALRLHACACILPTTTSKKKKNTARRWAPALFGIPISVQFLPITPPPPSLMYMSRLLSSHILFALVSCPSSISPFFFSHSGLSTVLMAPTRSKGRKSKHGYTPSASRYTPTRAQLRSTRNGRSSAQLPPSNGIQTLQHNEPIRQKASTLHNSLETLPVEVVNNIFSYLVQPRSRLPGLTECQSNYDFSKTEQGIIKQGEDKTMPPDSDRHFADLFSWLEVRHPFNVLAATSKRCRELVESYCAHLVKTCNKFNLPFAHLEAYGPDCVYPSLSAVVFRRLWLQTAPRRCVFCDGTLSHYPHAPQYGLMLTCENCFYAQAFVSLNSFQSLSQVQ
jgi:hypothetical protein